MIPAQFHGSDLCIPCGLCCDGSLFERAHIQPGEEIAVKALGLVVLDAESEKPTFSQPCNQFINQQCAVYAQRPHVCVKFRCKLLQKIENGKIGFSNGLAKVQQARVMQTELSRLLPKPVDGTISLAEVKRQMQALSKDEAQERRAHLNFLLLAAKYEMFLRTNFLMMVQKNVPSTDLPVMEAGNHPDNQLT